MSSEKKTIGFSDLTRLKRLADIVKDAIFGIALFAGAFPVLWTIEGSMIDERAALVEFSLMSEKAQADQPKIDEEKENDSAYRASIETQLAEKRSWNTVKTWAGRALGFAMLTFGLFVLAPPLGPVWERFSGVNRIWERGLIQFSLAAMAFVLTTLTVLLRWLWANIFVAIGIAVAFAGWILYQRRKQNRKVVDVEAPLV